MSQWQIGAVRVTRIVELELPGIKWIIREAVPENCREIPWLAPHFVTTDWVPIASVHALIVESQGQRIMVDTCIGNDKTLAIKFWSNRKGPFLDDLNSAGFPPESIDTVLCTHLHPDHVGWNTSLINGRWTATFPRAQYLFGRVEWEHWDREDRETPSTLMEQSVRPIIDAGLHRLVESDHRINDEVWLEPTPGHTHGHVSVRIRSEGKEAAITGDIMHHPVQMARPHWKCVADLDPEKAIATRIDFMKRFADTPTLVIGTHFAAPTAGHIVRDGDVFRFEV
jgi:glyoxylase-like metal-dependent hydrolase (beta-lactamase superfamily II)